MSARDAELDKMCANSRHCGVWQAAGVGGPVVSGDLVQQSQQCDGFGEIGGPRDRDQDRRRCCLQASACCWRGEASGRIYIDMKGVEKWIEQSP